MDEPKYIPRRRNQPMQSSSFKAAARTLRKMADQIEARADAETPRERAARTSAINRVALYAKHLSQRNRRRR